MQAPVNATSYWDGVVYLLSQYPTLADSGVAAFTYLYPNTTSAGVSSGNSTASFEALFALYNPASKAALEDLLNPLVRHINKTYGSEYFSTSVSTTIFPKFNDMFQKFADNKGAGVDKVVGSRLLPPAVLAQSAFRDSLIEFLGDAGGRLYMVSGKGVWDAKPRGGSNAVNPAWRKALIHAGKSSVLTLVL